MPRKNTLKAIPHRDTKPPETSIVPRWISGGVSIPIVFSACLYPLGYAYLGSYYNYFHMRFSASDVQLGEIFLGAGQSFLECFLLTAPQYRYLGKLFALLAAVGFLILFLSYSGKWEWDGISGRGYKQISKISGTLLVFLWLSLALGCLMELGRITGEQQARNSRTNLCGYGIRLAVKKRDFSPFTPEWEKANQNGQLRMVDQDKQAYFIFREMDGNEPWPPEVLEVQKEDVAWAVLFKPGNNLKF